MLSSYCFHDNPSTKKLNHKSENYKLGILVTQNTAMASKGIRDSSFIYMKEGDPETWIWGLQFPFSNVEGVT